ncbi:hypothetical protein ERJ75_001337800 [Trypanosoma vivax]|uniref:Uncharacterized protein n=1 Tax=Trypanosoma vivax (strain Y486) TaxID=1055687 RepID=G0U664_TRYVY|nr:hypothetical protein ERJ75_001337800 [Trypanosoma vivax]CCC51367.1 conserved hypothetical protein [Trypanosoma vivax Y486]
MPFHEGTVSLSNPASVDWPSIAQLPFNEWEKSLCHPQLKHWIEKISKIFWRPDDNHFSQPRYTTAIMRLLRVVAAAYCENEARLKRECDELRRFVDAASGVEETKYPHESFSRADKAGFATVVKQSKKMEGRPHGLFPNVSRAVLKSQCARSEFDGLTEGPSCVPRDSNSVRECSCCCSDQISKLSCENQRLVLENKHLLDKYKELLERDEKVTEIMRDQLSTEVLSPQEKGSEVSRLRRKVRELQLECYNLIRARNEVERCEHLEANALRDFTESGKLHSDALERERENVRILKAELQHRQEVDNRVVGVSDELGSSLSQLKNENLQLRRLLEGSSLVPQAIDDVTTESSCSADFACGSKRLGEYIPSEAPFCHCSADSGVRDLQQHLVMACFEKGGHEADAKVLHTEFPVTGREKEDGMVCRAHGCGRCAEVLHSLRRRLTESNREICILSEENTQLKKAVAAGEDYHTFLTALQELCIRMGATQEEIERLRPNDGLPPNELEVLRGEVSALREEVEWLEHERMYWMNKVRLGSLPNTKQYLNLAPMQEIEPFTLVAEEKTVGGCADTVGKHLSGDCTGKDVHQSQLESGGVSRLNKLVERGAKEIVCEEVENSEVSSSVKVTSALQAIRDHINHIVAQVSLSEREKPTSNQVSSHEQLSSALNLLEESEHTIKDYVASQTALREQLIALRAERDTLMRERDEYRSSLFETLRSFQGRTPLIVAGEPGFVGHQTQDVNTVRSNVKKSENLSLLARASPSSYPEDSRYTSLESGVRIASVVRTLEDQLLTKDKLIASLTSAVAAAKEELEQCRITKAETAEKLSTLTSQCDILHNQLAAMHQVNEELNCKLNVQGKIIDDFHETLRRMDSASIRELMQKIVLLRQREGKLLQRLRCAMEMERKSSLSEQTMRDYVNNTFKSLKDALENTSTGFVLPRSSVSSCIEDDVLAEIREQLEGVLQGKHLKEDTAYLAQLQHVYCNMEHAQELDALRLEVSRRRQDMMEMERVMEEQRIELDSLQKLHKNLSEVSCSRGAGSDDMALAVRWETEATTWRQKCSLYMKRYEEKEKELSFIEAELEGSRKELALLREHMYNIDNKVQTFSEGSMVSNFGEPLPVGERLPGGKPQIPSVAEVKQLCCGKKEDSRVRSLEREVARLKSINLGVLHYSLDLQGECKRLEIELDATKQEMLLLLDTENSKKVSDFVSAAIRQHAALRSQSELALLRAKRARIQLSATEANLYVAVNEATSYKLSAFRLYRRYVAQTIAVVDYIRTLRRDADGSLSPHRVEIMHNRLTDAIRDAEHSRNREAELAVQLAESKGMVSLLQEQLGFFSTKDDASSDTLQTKLLTCMTAVREKDVKLAELSEDHSHLEQKLKRAEMHIKRLTEEVTRLELVASGTSVLGESVLKDLKQLQETIFAKVESPAVIIKQRDIDCHELDDGNDVAVREYRLAVDKHLELTRECEALKKQLDDEVAEGRKANSLAEALKEETEQLRERLQQAQRQLQEERQRFEEREQRVIRSHEAQAHVAHRAAEHNNQCLRDMLQSKEAYIKQLEEQLQAERKKFIECKIEESTRVERLHEHLFKENNAMVERFREAISGVAERYDYSPPATAVPALDGLSGQLEVLTKETLRLKAELKDARMTNILLESQLNDQVARAQQQLSLAVDQRTSVGESTGDQSYQQLQPRDTVVGVINEQNAIIESLRQREFGLARELQRSRSERDALESQLNEVRNLVVEQGGVLKSVVAAEAMKPGYVESELRAQLSYLERNLAEARSQLEEERLKGQRLQVDTGRWRLQLDQIREEVVRQKSDVERARRLVAMNESLAADVRLMEEQNKQLLLATNILKERVMDEMKQRSDASRRHQHELALAHRMGNLQQESSEHIKNVGIRLQSIQCELEEKVRREEEALKKNDQMQQLAYELHTQLQEREREVCELRREMATLASRTPVASGERSLPNSKITREKGVQVLQTHREGVEASSNDFLELHEPANKKASHNAQGQCMEQHRSAQSSQVRGPVAAVESSEAESAPQAATAIQQMVGKPKGVYLCEASSLCATVDRLKNDLNVVSQRLEEECKKNRLLQIQLQGCRCELANGAPRSSLVMRKKLFGGSAAASGATLSSETKGTNVQLLKRLREQSNENERLKRQLEDLKRCMEKHGVAGQEAGYHTGELVETKDGQLPSADSVYTASALDVRNHKRIVLKLESTIDALRRELNVNKEAKLRALQKRVEELTVENQRLTAELSHYKGFPVSVGSLGTLGPDAPSNRASLECELLEKSSALLDLRFEREALQLKVVRLERHVEELLRSDSTGSKCTVNCKQRVHVESLETLVENLKVVIERLRHENMQLKSKSVSISKHMDLVRELRELRARERELLENSERLSKRILDFSSGGSAMSERHAKLQKKLHTTQVELEQQRAEVLELRRLLNEHGRPLRNASENECPMVYVVNTDPPPGPLNRRSVQPLDVDEQDLPPPLPRAP